MDAADVDRGLAGATARDAVLASFAQAGPEAPARLEARRHARVAIAGDEPWRAVALRLVAAAGLTVAGDRETRRSPGCWSAPAASRSAPTSTR